MVRLREDFETARKCKHTSQRVMPVFGSSMAGTRPLGLTDSNGSFFRSPKSIILVSYLRPSSSHKMAIFHGLGPCWGGQRAEIRA